MKTRKEKIEAIYEKIADKTLSFGCKIVCGAIIKNKFNCFYYDIFIHKGMGFNSYFQNEKEKVEVNGNYLEKIIGHPVMIGDVMDWIERNFPDGIHCIECKKGEVVSDNFNDNTFFYCNNKDCEFTSKFYGDEVFCNKMELYDGYWKEKRKPIEAQSDECVDFVYDLIF